MPSNVSQPSSSASSLRDGQSNGFSEASGRRESICSVLNKEWSDFSVVLEMKMGEMAVVTISCPMGEFDNDSGDNGVIKFGDKSIEFIREEKQSDGSVVSKKRLVNFTNIRFEPNTVKCGVWSDQNGLFCCKVELGYRDYLGGIRRFSDLQSFMANKVPLKDFAHRLTHNGMKIFCAECRASILEVDGDKKMDIQASEELDLLEGGVDLSEYAYHSCSHEHGARNVEDDGKKEECNGLTPSNKKPILTETQFWMRYNNSYEKQLLLDKSSFIVSCKGCVNEIGRMCKDNENVVKLDMSAVIIEDPLSPKCIIEERFHSMERYFAYLLLRYSAFDNCLKLMVRTLEKVPYVMVWLVEPIFLFADGKMKEETECSKNVKAKPCKLKKKALTDSSLIHAYTSLKVLYNVFDAESAKTSPAAQDRSVTYIDLPQTTCMRFEEVLLRNSARLPAQNRFLGNFMISFLTVDDE
ncbi:unnamed protein product [Bursaphelenchus okinawaensis]|uniref:E3 ubiquitin-protein ligase E3D n=1 Tax=Bursaphelenchus okinawaensis TaxID=465554 RepID=A0A811JUT9_9BILA|nr:unnamed protein product [Bursaphelenchus okinawaensis]CAG9083448.1 unnamed protein product [Bursaphelenchus okinawaensis]